MREGRWGREDLRFWIDDLRRVGLKLPVPRMEWVDEWMVGLVDEGLMELNRIGLEFQGLTRTGH